MLLPERADWPLPPRPLVLPWPPPSPQPTRFFRCTAPGTFFSSCSFIWFFPLWRPDQRPADRDSDCFSKLSGAGTLNVKGGAFATKPRQEILRTLEISSASRSLRKPASVACTTAMWFEEPIDLVRIF